MVIVLVIKVKITESSPKNMSACLDHFECSLIIILYTFIRTHHLMSSLQICIVQ